MATAVTAAAPRSSSFLLRAALLLAGATRSCLCSTHALTSFIALDSAVTTLVRSIDGGRGASSAVQQYALRPSSSSSSSSSSRAHGAWRQEGFRSYVFRRRSTYDSGARRLPLIASAEGNGGGTTKEILSRDQEVGWDGGRVGDEEGQDKAHDGTRGGGDDGEDGEDGEDYVEQEARITFPELVNPFKLAFEAGRKLRVALAENLEQITGTASPLEGVKIRSLEEYEKRLYSPFDSEEEVPTVLVVGATGEMGRVVVRKLLLRGFAVRVLVRNLYSSTLDLLGTGATFAQGDLTNYRSIVDAVSGVDKVIFCAQARDPSQAEKVEFEGLRNLVGAFQDQRVALYGDPYSTKKTLFRFNRPGDRDLWSVEPKSQQSSKWIANKFGYGTFGSTRMYEAGYAVVESAKIDLDLGGFSGLPVRCCGDGKEYRFILRDKDYETNGIQYESAVRTRPNKWQTHRMSFSSFEAYRDGQPLVAKAGKELNRNAVQQFAVGYKRSPVDPFNFILSMHFMKVYRTQIEPEFIYVSSAGVPPITNANYESVLEALKVKSPKCYYSARGEELLRQSGLTYTIIRVEGFNNRPGGLQAIEIKQDPENVGLISRADAAEITVQCLLDPRACNLALYTSTTVRTVSVRSRSEDVRPAWSTAARHLS